MTKNSLKWLLGIFFLSLVFYGCEETGEPEPNQNIDDKPIPINDTSAFNMQNFLASFEQMFVSDERWAWSFTHNVKDGKATETYQNYSKYGEFGDKVFTIQHTYDANGVIVSSLRLAGSFEENEVTFTYGFDLDGNIVKLTKSVKGKVRDVVHHEFNDKGQLVRKIHEALNEGDEEWEEIFTYNADGQVTSWKADEDELTEYAYSNGRMVKETEYYNGEIDDVTTIEYDDKGRVIKESEDEDNYETVEYNGETLTMKYFWDGFLQEESVVSKGGKQVTNKEYRYAEGVFAYAVEAEYDSETLMINKKSLKTGEVDALQLAGYSIIDERHSESGWANKESFYNADGELVYTAEYKLIYDEQYDYWYRDVTTWYDAEGSIIEGGFVEEFAYLLSDSFYY